MTAEERFVILASSPGTVFEWYDFYIYGALGVFLAKTFFSDVAPAIGFIFTLLAFAAGFVHSALCCSDGLATSSAGSTPSSSR